MTSASGEGHPGDHAHRYHGTPVWRKHVSAPHYKAGVIVALTAVPHGCKLFAVNTVEQADLG
ncbi:MAG: hypothetical protein IH988_08075 [Planctomycetes bacterium]|nr:hypothetical protein [Planctomycetota bacterium]